MARRPAGPKEYVVHPSLTFHVGEKVVYPNHGVATIENISSRAFLSDGRCQRRQDWKDRFKENSEKMQNGSLLAVAEVMKGLLLLQLEKPLSFREKKMLDRARHMLITEFSTSRGLHEAEAVDMLEKALNKAQLKLPEAL
jgi:CarD family transcriptional regulator